MSADIAKHTESLLNCPVCMELFDNTAKVLPCQHTFCLPCLRRCLQDSQLYSYRVVCPICRKSCQVPAGGVDKLPNDFRVGQFRDLVEQIQRQASSSSLTAAAADSVRVRCSVCQYSNLSSPAVVRCQRCNKNFCQQCHELHTANSVFRDHVTQPVRPETDSPDAQGTPGKCRAHVDEELSYFCEQCERLVCTVCVLAADHRDHTIVSGDDVVQSQRRILASRLSEVRQEASLVSSCRVLLAELSRKQTEMYDDCRAAVERLAAEARDSIDAQKSELLAELERGAETQRHVTRLAEQTLRQTVEQADGLTETVSRELQLAGKPGEAAGMTSSLHQRRDDLFLTLLELMRVGGKNIVTAVEEVRTSDRYWIGVDVISDVVVKLGRVQTKKIEKDDREQLLRGSQLSGVVRSDNTATVMGDTQSTDTREVHRSAAASGASSLTDNITEAVVFYTGSDVTENHIAATSSVEQSESRCVTSHADLDTSVDDDSSDSRITVDTRAANDVSFAATATPGNQFSSAQLKSAGVTAGEKSTLSAQSVSAEPQQNFAAATAADASETWRDIPDNSDDNESLGVESPVQQLLHSNLVRMSSEPVLNDAFRSTHKQPATNNHSDSPISTSLSEEGGMQLEWSVSGLRGCRGLCFLGDSGELLATSHSTDGCRLCVYDVSGTVVRRLTGNLLVQPWACCYSAQLNTLAVTDRESTAVKIMKASLSIRDLSAWRGAGVTKPNAIAITRSNSLYMLTDAARATSSPRVSVHTHIAGRIVKLRSFPGTEHLGHGLNFATVDQHDRIVLADSDDGRILVYDVDGHRLLEFSCDGAQSGQKMCPQGVATDVDGNILVADQSGGPGPAGRLLRFSPDGLLIDVVREWKDESPWGVAYNPTGRHLAVSTDNALYVYRL